jgi:hypothetical protein
LLHLAFLLHLFAPCVLYCLLHFVFDDSFLK